MSFLQKEQLGFYNIFVTKSIDGMTFGDLIVLKRGEDYIYPNGKKRPRYWCKCICGRKHLFIKTSLMTGKVNNCPTCSNNKRVKNIVGKRFGRYLVLDILKSDSKRKSRGRYYKCVCDCGNKREVLGSSLISGKSVSCGCYAIEKVMESKRIDIFSGDVFGDLTVLYFEGYKKRRSYFSCICSCGNKISVKGNSLKTGNTTSCGCNKKESKIVKELKKYLGNKYSIEKEYNLFKNPKTNLWIRCDIYIKELNTYIEVNGHQHYVLNNWHKKQAEKNNTTPENEFKKQKQRDAKVRRFCRKNGNYIEIDIRKLYSISLAIEYLEKEIKNVKLHRKTSFKDKQSKSPCNSRKRERI